MTTSAPRTVADLLDAAAARSPDRLALIGDTERWTWSQLAGRTRRLAAALVGLGLSPGDRLVLQVGNRPDFVLTYVAAARAGLVVVPVNPAYTLSELGEIVTDCDARALVTSSVATIAAAERVRAEHPGLAHLVVAAPRAPAGALVLEDLLGSGDGLALPPVRADEDVAVLLYTSGTSGRPKGAMLSHRALLANVAQVAAISPPLAGPDDVLGLFVPLVHVYGLGAGLGLALHHGVTIVLAERFDPVETLRLIAEQGVSVVLGAPPVFAAWAAVPGFGASLGGVRLALSGAAPLPPALVAAYAEAGVALHEGYGLTETAPVVSLDAVDAAGHSRVGHPVPGSVGAPIPGVEVAIVDATGGGPGAAVEDGDPGVLRVRGANLFSGYWPSGADGPDAEGWFTTGDVGYRDAAGDLYLVGRDVELVLVNGFNVYPAEVERVLAAGAGVEEVAVVGEPDERTGERVVAYVVPAGPDLDPADLLTTAGRSLARFKVPSRVEIVDALPHSGIGKVQKWRLRPDEQGRTPGGTQR